MEGIVYENNGIFMVKNISEIEHTKFVFKEKREGLLQDFTLQNNVKVYWNDYYGKDKSGITYKKNTFNVKKRSLTELADFLNLYNSKTIQDMDIELELFHSNHKKQLLEQISILKIEKKSLIQEKEDLKKQVEILKEKPIIKQSFLKRMLQKITK